MRLSILIAISLFTPALSAQSESDARDRAWIVEQFDARLFPSLEAQWKKTPDADASQLAWGVSYQMAGLAQMLEVTREPKYAEALARIGTWVAACRDDRHGRKDEYRDRIVPAWGTTRYTDGRHYVWAVHTGMIAAPLARFAAIVREDPKLKPRFGEKAEQLLDVAREAVAVHDDLFRDGPGEDEGYVFSLHLKRHLPLNQQNALARAWLYIDRATGKPEYRERIEKLARFFKRRIRTEDNGALTWAYWPGVEPPFNNGCEDVSHAAINVDFLAICSREGIVFDESDVDALRKTLLLHVLRHEGTSSDVCGKERERASYAAQIPRWSRIARGDRKTCHELLAFMKRGMFKNSSTDPLGLALLLEAHDSLTTRPAD